MAKNKEIIAVDYDDCVVPFDIPFRNWMHDEHGIDLLSVKAIEGKFHYDEAYPDSGLTAKEFTELLNQYTLTKSIETPAYEAATEGLTLLVERYDLQIVTARPPTHKAITIESVKLHFPGIFSDVHTAEYSGDHKMTSKVSTYRKIGAFAAIDDADHNVNAAIGAGLVGISIQYPSHNHNGHNLFREAVVASNLTEVPHLLSSLTLGSMRHNN